MGNRYIAELRFFFEEEIGVIKDITGLIPEREWVKGERTHGSIGAVHDKNGFSVRAELSQDRPLEDHISLIIQKVQNSSLISKIDLFKGSIELKIVIYTDKLSDGFHLERDQLILLAQIGVEIDMEFYSL